MNTFQFKPYEYDPLPTPSSIRLVSLLKTQNTAPRPSIAGVPLLPLSLKTVDLHDNPKFFALSYTWGWPFPQDSALRGSTRKGEDDESYDHRYHRYPVAINGRLLYISRNLYEFLCNFNIEDDDEHWHQLVNKRYAPFNKTGLIQAAEKGSLHEVLTYLSHSADLTAQDQFGETALHYAAENGHYEIVKLLVKAGADQICLDSTHRTPLACAKMRRRRQYRQVIDFLDSTERQQEELGNIKLPPPASKPLWIDSISSNQENISERNAQVGLMPWIYGSAQKTIVWLGLADELTSYGHDVLNRSHPQESWAQKEQVWRDTVRETTKVLDPYRMNVEDLSPEAARAFREYRALVSITERAWFQRVWTLQEILLGADHEYLCGQYKFTNLDQNTIVRDREKWHGDHRGAYNLSGISSRGGTGTDRTELPGGKGPGFAALHRLSLQGLVAMSSEMTATDPRDRLFALLSLSQEPHGIVVDYSTPVSELFTRFAASFMEGSSEKGVLDPLEGLSYVQPFAPRHRKNSDLFSYRGDLPSWVPDFAQATRTRHIWSHQFSAGMDFGPPEIFPVDNPRMIGVMGLVSDEIVAVEPSPMEMLADFGAGFPSSKRWMEFILPLAPKYHTQEGRIEALWRTIIANDIWQNAPPEAGAREGFRGHVRLELGRSQSPLDHVTAHCLDELLADDDAADSLPSKQEIEETHRMIADANKITCRLYSLGNMESNFDFKCSSYYKARRLFRTAKGYLGLGPFTVLPGDQVWLISGTRVPFVLRKETGGISGNDAWRLIGEAYIHGIMNGEAAEGRSCTELEPVILV